MILLQNIIFIALIIIMGKVTYKDFKNYDKCNAE